MKHQISKVVFIATLAFVGVGFAGTQQANAAPCKPQVAKDWFLCGDELLTPEEAAKTVVSEVTDIDTSLVTPCFDTDGDCKPDTSYNVTTVHATCTRANGESQSCLAVGYSPNETDCNPPAPAPLPPPTVA